MIKFFIESNPEKYKKYHISIIIIYDNNLNNLKKTIKSIFNQTYIY